VIAPVSRDVKAVVIGVVVQAIFTFWMHEWVIGVRPLALAI